jgi:hypothetical protein
MWNLSRKFTSLIIRFLIYGFPRFSREVRDLLENLYVIYWHYTSYWYCFVVLFIICAAIHHKLVFCTLSCCVITDYSVPLTTTRNKVPMTLSLQCARKYNWPISLSGVLGDWLFLTITYVEEVIRCNWILTEKFLPVNFHVGCLTAWPTSIGYTILLNLTPAVIRHFSWKPVQNTHSRHFEHKYKRNSRGMLNMVVSEAKLLDLTFRGSLEWRSSRCKAAICT